MTRVVWLRDDLYLAGNPAVAAAVSAAALDEDARVVPLVVVQSDLWEALSTGERSRRLDALRSLDDALDGHLLFFHAAPDVAVPSVAQAASARDVHVTRSARPADEATEAAVEEALGIPLLRHDRAAGDTSTPMLDGVRWWMPIECHGYPGTAESRGRRSPRLCRIPVGPSCR